MTTSARFSEQMQAYGRWREGLTAGIERYQQWLTLTGMGDVEDEQRIGDILTTLKAEKLTIAFVAEFARGKTELINAIFFSEFDRRLLPSEAGRTTMCPTELLYDEKSKNAYIRLLPIETRLQERSLSDYKREPVQWSSLPLDLDDGNSMSEAFSEIVKTKSVTIDEARELGLFSDADREFFSRDGVLPERIDIPVWRHAIISFPHPLLKQGLVILDTPGLNAVGTEPELTLNMLPNAQGVIFVMSADTGVTKSDLDMWNLNVKPLRNNHQKGLIVVLNKIDTLWDDLKSAETIDATVQVQCRKASEMLGIPVENVIPVSAQKGLLAKIRHNHEVLQRSNILTLESILANDIIPSQQQMVSQHVKGEIGGMIKESHAIVINRLRSAKAQMEELGGLTGKNRDVIEHLMVTTREEQVEYHKSVEAFNANKKLLSDQSKELLRLLDLTKLDELVNSSREAMTGTWTTAGLKRGMKTFFEGINDRFTQLNEYTEQLNRLVSTVYHKFNAEHDIPDIEPVLFTVAEYTKEMDRLYQEAEDFRNSPVTTMTEQSFVVKKFFISLVSHARNLFFKAHRDAEVWRKSVLTPLVKHISERKAEMDSRLENLRKVSESQETLEQRMGEIKTEAIEMKKQYDEITTIYKLIHSQ
ncbi:MAG: dynamin family protein [Gammaproteobacteria bacterium]|nr:dynamin family protein [Gammaproteobacteria bacterium]